MPSQNDFDRQEDDYWAQWIDYDRQSIRHLLNRKKTLMNYASFHPGERAVVGVFSLFSIQRRKRKKFKMVTEVHYHNACNELAMMLWGILSKSQDSMLVPYITPEDFDRGRDGYRFHKAIVRRFHIMQEQSPKEYFNISIRLERVRRIRGVVYAQFDVQDHVNHAVKGRLVYSYVPLREIKPHSAPER